MVKGRNAMIARNSKMFVTDVPTYLPTYLPTDTARCRVACPRLKKKVISSALLVTKMIVKKLRMDWQGQYFCSPEHLGRSSEADDLRSKKIKKGTE